MREPFTQLYVHLVWATWDRLPLITPSVEARLYGHMLKECRGLKCLPIRIGGIENHTHLLVRLHPTIAVSELVKQVKGSSSHLMNHEIAPQTFFKRQGAYGAFTLRKDDVQIVKEYIANQRVHHAGNSIWDELEKTEVNEVMELEEFDLEEDEVLG